MYYFVYLQLKLNSNKVELSIDKFIRSHPKGEACDPLHGRVSNRTRFNLISITTAYTNSRFMWGVSLFLGFICTSLLKCIKAVQIMEVLNVSVVVEVLS